MSDDHELDRLKAALKGAEPRPDPARKADAMARAMAGFDRMHGASQGSSDAARPMSSRPSRAGIWTGATAMFDRLTTRAALAGTASIAVIGLGIVLVAPYASAPPDTVSVKSGERVQVAPAATTVAPVPMPETTEADLHDDADVGAVTAIAPSAQARQEPRQREANQPALPEADFSADALAPAPAPEPAEGRAQGGAGDESLAQSAPAIVAPKSEVETEMAEEGFAGGLAADADMAPSESLARRTLAAPQPGADVVVQPEASTEAYPEAAPNPLRVTAEAPVSTFSIDVDTASYAVVRSSLNAGRLPPEGAVRIEEMVNYFPYAWPAPGEGEGPFRPSVSVMETPWNTGTQLVTVALQGKMPAAADRPPLNLVFLIDTSGSMNEPNKLPLLQQSFRLMLGELRPGDEVAIVTYAGSAGMALAPTPAGDRDTILAALDRLDAGGSTAGQAGLQQAYALAREMAEDGEVTRVILATDGDFNVGLSDPEALKAFVAEKRRDGTYLSVLGFGRGNLDDATMQALAQNGNGQAAYIDTLTEARKVLVDQLSGALFPIADDVKIQIEWNPATVAEYRLIGYETRALAREDFANDRVDAGEIGAGHSVTAIYEITPVGSPARQTEPLRYGAGEAAPRPEGAAEFADELGFLRLRYKEPGAARSQLIETPIATGTAEAGTEARFAAAIAGMGQLLTGATYLGDWGWDEAIALATSARGDDPFGYRAEAINLMRLAESLSR